MPLPASVFHCTAFLWEDRIWDSGDGSRCPTFCGTPRTVPTVPTRRSSTNSKEETSLYYCYIVRCRDNTLYTGITNNLEKRIAVHNKGKGGAYTASRCPVELVYSECVGTKSEALRRELQIKSFTREKKLALIKKGS